MLYVVYIHLFWGLECPQLRDEWIWCLINVHFLDISLHINMSSCGERGCFPLCVIFSVFGLMCLGWSPIHHVADDNFKLLIFFSSLSDFFGLGYKIVLLSCLFLNVCVCGGVLLCHYVCVACVSVCPSVCVYFICVDNHEGYKRVHRIPRIWNYR